MKNGAMVFVLPDEGVSVQELIQSAETLREALSGTNGQSVGERWSRKAPKFSYGYKAEGGEGNVRPWD